MGDTMFDLEKGADELDAPSTASTGPGFNGGLWIVDGAELPTTDTTGRLAPLEPAPAVVEAAETPWSAATRVLETAASAAEQLVEEARREAETTVAEAQARAAEVTEAARLEAEEVREALAIERTALQEQIAALRASEEDQRNRMRHHLTQHLTMLDAQQPEAPVAAAG